MNKIYQSVICPLLGTFYLVGGYEFGHRWRQIEGESRIYCARCLKQKSILIYTHKWFEKTIIEDLRRFAQKA